MQPVGNGLPLTVTPLALFCPPLVLPPATSNSHPVLFWLAVPPASFLIRLLPEVVTWKPSPPLLRDVISESVVPVAVPETLTPSPPLPLPISPVSTFRILLLLPVTWTPWLVLPKASALSTVFPLPETRMPTPLLFEPFPLCIVLLSPASHTRATVLPDVAMLRSSRPLPSTFHPATSLSAPWRSMTKMLPGLEALDVIHPVGRLSALFGSWSVTLQPKSRKGLS